MRRRGLYCGTVAYFLAAGMANGITAAWSQATVSGNITVTDAESARQALAAAHPGDTITFAPGDYDLGTVRLTAFRATPDKPLLIRAQTGGKARLVGKTGFVFTRTSCVTLSGFDFATEDVSPVQILGSDHIRVMENRFQVKEPADGKARRWVFISAASAANDTPPRNSEQNRIDHNRFEGKHTIGNFIGINGLGGRRPEVSQNDRIDSNYFHDIGPRIPNGMEAIRVGLSGMSLSSGRTQVEENLFEGCDGDPEVISVKTSDATVRNNTFRACQGGLCLRHGNRNTVSGNVFLGAGKAGTDGVRVYGDDHTISGNYFDDLRGAALQITNGDVDYGVDYTKGGPLPDDETVLKRHVRPQRITFQGNRLVNCARPIVLGTAIGDKNKQVPARDIRFIENSFALFASPSGTPVSLVSVGTLPEALSWKSNVLYTGRSEAAPAPVLPGSAASGEDALRIVNGPAPPLPQPRSLTAKDVGPAWLR